MRLSLVFSSAALIASVLATESSSYVNNLHLESTTPGSFESSEKTFSTQKTFDDEELTHYKREDDDFSQIISQAASDLSRAVKDMRDCFRGSRFETGDFYWLEGGLRQSIKAIREQIQEEATRTSLDAQFDLAWEMYLVMREARIEIEKWNGIHFKGTELISQMHEITVLVFKFLDDSGVPKREMEGYEEGVQALFDKWFDLGKAYLALPNKDFVRDHFTLRFINSRKSLERLR